MNYRDLRVLLFSRCASASANATILETKELNKVVRLVKDKPQRLLYAPIKGVPRLMGFPDAAYKNNSDGSSQRGQCIFICQPRNKERDMQGSLIDTPRKIKRTVLSTTVAEFYAFMKCYGSAQFYRGLWMDMICDGRVSHRLVLQNSPNVLQFFHFLGSRGFVFQM